MVSYMFQSGHNALLQCDLAVHPSRGAIQLSFWESGPLESCLYLVEGCGSVGAWLSRLVQRSLAEECLFSRLFLSELSCCAARRATHMGRTHIGALVDSSSWDQDFKHLSPDTKCKKATASRWIYPKLFKSPSYLSLSSWGSPESQNRGKINLLCPVQNLDLLNIWA